MILTECIKGWLVAIYCNSQNAPISTGNTEETLRIDKDNTRIYGPFNNKNEAASWALQYLDVEEYSSHRVVGLR